MQAQLADTKKVEYFMSKDLISVSKNTSIKEVFDLFKSSGLSHLPVMDGEFLVGMISKEDLLEILLRLNEKTSGRRFTDIYLRTENVTKIMSMELISVQKDDHRDYAVELLLQNKFHSLPVVDEDGRLIGMVTALDLLKGYYEVLFRMSSL